MYVGARVCISYTGAHLRYDITMQLLYLCIFDENKVVFFFASVVEGLYGWQCQSGGWAVGPS